MPVKACSTDGKPGWKYGDTGTCYTYTKGDDAASAAAKKKAVRQAIAIGGGKPPSDLSDRELADAKMKTCRECKTARPVARFPEDKRTSDGRSAVCVQCRFEGSSHSERGFAELETVNLDGVEILSAGGPYFGTGSPEEGDHFDSDYLKELAANNNALREEVSVPIKVGHSAGQRLLKNSGLFADEQPAAGWVENFRVARGKLLADLKSVPKKLADLIDTGGFRKRSVELTKVKSQTDDGKEYEVVSALALLGAKAPAVRTLNDIVTQWYSEDDGYDHMEETIRLLMLDVENDTDARTVDYAAGDVVWEGENGSSDWIQDLTSALNANAPTTGNPAEMSPFYVQDIDQLNKRAIVTDYRTNSTWVVPFVLNQDDDPIPAPQESWTLAEQAWVQSDDNGASATSASGSTSAPDSGSYSDAEPNATQVGDTLSVAESTQKPKAELSDEQVAKFAEMFGITEDDAAKRKEAVVVKLAEFVPPVESGEQEQSEQDKPASDTTSTDTPTAALSDDDRRVIGDARTFMENTRKSQIEANLTTAARMWKINPESFPRWRTFMEADYDLAVEQLAALPINAELMRTYGSDVKPDDEGEDRDEALFREYAARTGVPLREVAS